MSKSCLYGCKICSKDNNCDTCNVKIGSSGDGSYCKYYISEYYVNPNRNISEKCSDLYKTDNNDEIRVSRQPYLQNANALVIKNTGDRRLLFNQILDNM